MPWRLIPWRERRRFSRAVRPGRFIGRYRAAAYRHEPST
ncbi:hypothetical protein BURCENBC7_AP0106 [Burkholderia cenocepacia BC7]|nr:hypothetical protein BURCENBC7_AP0106 [Burkholderia cenocepacia BC7]